MKKRHERLIKKYLAIFTLVTFLLQPGTLAFAAPTAQADASADADKQPTVTEQNNVTVVDIAEANASGLSHNQYLNFDVGPNGLILNNNAMGGPINTELLNNLQVNPNLQGRAATIILNEVTGSGYTNLNGTLEVGGSRASVIIANPNGIVGSDFGFINTDRVTLTTGTPTFDGGNLGFNVEKGQVNIYGDGLKVEQMPSKLDILSRATQINSQLWADQELNIITGTNKINYSNLAITGQTTGQGSVPALALDVRALGGMYAGKIRLIGTEQGLGVNIQGEISASKDLSLTNDGKIVLKGSGQIDPETNLELVGSLDAKEKITINSTDSVIVYGESQITSNNQIDITAKNITSSGVIAAGLEDEHDDDDDPGEQHVPFTPSDLNLTATDKILNTGMLASSKDVNLQGNQVIYEKQDITTDKLVVNGTEIDLTPDTTTPPTAPVDEHKNPLIPDLPTIDPSDLIAKQQDEDLKLTADTSAGQNTPIIDKTNSGIDLVQIATPSAGGVSRNSYTDFNIKTSGLILNNATQYTNTQLGGWIDRNIRLGIPATIILNEVTSGNNSQLNGFLEVAGNKASVIIANPNGIAVNGLGYINVNNATLTTGSNNLTIQGEGINATHTNSLNLNANNIINNASEIYANNFTANADTQLTNNGRIITDGNVNINTTNLSNTANSLISSKGNLAINASGTVQNNQAVITVDGNTSINANDLNNTNNAAIFTGGNLNLNITDQLTNNDVMLVTQGKTTITASNIDNLNNSLIYSVGDLSLTASNQILNQSASMESKGNITIDADTLINEKQTFQTDWTITYENYAYRIARLPQANYYDAIRRFQRTVKTGTILNETAAGQILADGNITIRVDNDLINHYSIIAAGEDLKITADEVQNYGYQGTIINIDNGADYHYWKYKKHRRFHIRCKWVYGVTTIPYYHWEEIDTNSSRLGILSAGDNVNITANTIDNKVFNAGGDQPAGRTNDKPYFPNIIDQLLTDTNSTLTINNQLFKQTDNPNANYVIETDPRFSDFKEFLSSDYMYERLTTDPERVMKRLGDGFYEQKLVTEQIAQLTGRKYLSNYKSEMEQFKALMNNALPFAAEFNLTIGVKLTKQQMAALTTDIVWLEEKEVNGQKVLVPVVYLATLKPGDLINGGAVIVGSDVEIFSKDNLTNVGTIKADKNLKIDANNITNKYGNIKANENLTLNAQEDLTNQSGLIQGKNIDITAKNITNETLTRTDELSGMNQTVLVKDAAGIVAEGNISLTAQEKITNKGAVISAGETLDLTAKDLEITSVKEEKHVALVQGQATLTQDQITHTGSWVVGKNINIDTDTTTIKGSTIGAEENITIKAENGIQILADKDYSNFDASVGNRGSSYFDRQKNVDETIVGSQIIAGKDLSIQSGDSILIKGSEIKSEEGKISLNATNDVNIVAETEYHESLHEQQTKSSTILSSKKKTIYDYNDQTAVVGSTISGNEIDITSGKDTNVIASNVVATKDLNVTTGGDLNVLSQEEYTSSYYKEEVKKSGIFGGGGLGITIGSQKKKDQYWSESTQQVGSNLASLEGNVNLNAGKDVNIKASDVLAKGDINIEGNNVSIISDENIYKDREKHEFKQSGLTISLGGAVGSIIDNVYQPLKRSSQASDDRLKWMGAMKAGWELQKGLGTIMDTQKTINGLQKEIDSLSKSLNPMDWYKAERLKDVKAVEQDKLWQINVSLGTTKWEMNKDSTTIISQGSTIHADGNVNIKAREQDINIKGSTVEGENITLQAQGNVNIEASQNSSKSDTNSKSSSSSIGGSIGLGSGGFTGGIGINGSKGKGQIHEDGTTSTESTLTAKDKLVIESGQDLNIIGSQVAGKEVDINVGSNLNIETLQDTDNYHEQNKNSNIGITAGVGLPSLNVGNSKQEIDSIYQSNQEQAGIFAGEGGFDINVGQNTDLKGGVISSKAEEDKNKISTDTLTFENIDNRAEWKAETDSSNISISGGKIDLVDTIIGAIPKGTAGSEDSADSTTKSAISKGEIEIRSDAGKEEKDKTDLSELSRDPSTANNPLDKIFDRDKILERQEAAALFGEMAFYYVGELSGKMGWKEGDPEKVLLHGLVGGLMAEINNGKFGEGLTVGALNEILVGMIDRNMVELGLSKSQIKSLSNLLGQAINGNQGATIAESATENNYLTEHQFLLMNTLKKLYETTGEYDKVNELMEFMGTIDKLQDWFFVNTYMRPNSYSQNDVDKAYNVWKQSLSNLQAEKMGYLNIDGTPFRPDDKYGQQYDKPNELTKISSLEMTYYKLNLEKALASLDSAKKIINSHGITESNPQYMDYLASNYLAELERRDILAPLNRELSKISTTYSVLSKGSSKLLSGSVLYPNPYMIKSRFYRFDIGNSYA